MVLQRIAVVWISPDAMRYLLALLAFRHLTGKTGIVRMSEVISTQGIAPKSKIINELLEADIMGQRDDGIVVYHPIIQAMMTPLPPFNLRLLGYGKENIKGTKLIETTGRPPLSGPA